MNWTKEKDAMLLAGIAKGLSRNDVSKQIGCSRNAAIARVHRINGVKFNSEIKRQKEKQIERSRKKKEKERKENIIITQMKIDLKNMYRKEAITKAYNAGATMRAIGKYLKVSYQRIQQIINPKP